MSLRRKLRSATPPALRQFVYDRSRTGRHSWQQAPGLERVAAADAAVLSFDDGPDPTFTPPLLDALDAAGARATFFVVGERVAGQEDLLREMVARGHEIGLHGMRHERHDGLAAAAAKRELGEGLAAIEAAGVPRPRRYRPPYGHPSPALAAACGELDVELAYWTAWGQDWEPLPAERIAALVVRDLRPGTVVLLHDSPLYAEREDAGPTIAAIEPIAAAAGERGLRLLSLELAGAAS
jgi:peptidoglycan/xylan/chitin deacetylase (PgdA/CDA1 family)